MRELITFAKIFSKKQKQIVQTHNCMKKLIAVFLLFMIYGGAIKAQPPVTEAQARAELEKRGLDEQIIRQKMLEKGIDIDKIDKNNPTEVLAAERALEEVIKELEAELSALSKAWSNHRKTFRENELAAGGIRELVDGAKVEYARIKRDYREIGAPYDQASQELASLVSRLRTARVRVDDENLLDVGGNLIPGR